MWLYSFFVFLCLFAATKAQCSWSSGGKKLDLSSIKGKQYTYNNGSFTYYFTPCEDDVSCKLSNGSTYSVMAMQYNPSKTICSSFLAKYDSSVTPSYSASDLSWTFLYSNGQASGSTCKNRYFTVTWKCDSSVSTTTAIKAGESKTCYYYFTLQSNLACGTSSGGSSSSSSEGLSGGWIFIILLLVVLVVYCIAGYIYNGYKHPENGWGNVKENVPNLTFWTAVPKWTWAGCCVTKDFIVGLFNKAANKSSQPATTSTE